MVARPLLLMVIGWYMATRQMIRKHSEDVRSALLLLHPAYCFFYTMFAAAAFVLVYQEWDRRQGDAECSEYFYDTHDKFGFLVDSFRNDGSTVFPAGSFLFRMAAVLVAQTAVAFGFAWDLRRRSAKLKDIKTFRVWIFRYSVTALAVGLSVFVMIALASPADARAASPCSFDPSSPA